ncbi:cation:proton antiporter [Candidatus Pacearchaeota archaeon]|nr:cation:proton antiporter [Candidatus Pacearchaeota archaeon]
MDHIFIQLGIILFMAFVVSYVVKAFRQPIIIGYILAGVVAAFVIETGFIDLESSREVIDIFSQFGIAFLLFIVGLHLNPKIIKEIGTSSLLIGLVQMVLTFIFGFFVASQLLGFDVINASYIAIALMFSSTIITMKLLSDKRHLDSLYGKMSIGILIIQDLVAVSALMFISSMSNGTNFSSFVLKGFLGGGGLIALLFLVGFFILPKVIKNIAKSQELLFLFSICWCFIIAALFSYFGFSIEIGALVAGVVLSISPYSTEISSKVRPLRDFFLIIFFIILGFNFPTSNLMPIFKNAVILSLFVLIFKPLVLMSLMALFGYTKRTNFLVGTTLAQISEFSLILVVLGLSVHGTLLDPGILPTIILTMIMTIIISTYMIIYSHRFYEKAYRFVSFFEKKKIKKVRKIKKEYDAILFGYNRIGFSILRSLRRIKKNYLVVDFNPDTIESLTKFGVPCIYGDVYDVELLKELPLDKIKLAVSTLPDFETNFLLIESIRVVNPDAIIIVRAHQIKEALDLYKKGASYVLTPHFLGGEYVAQMIEDDDLSPEKYFEEKNKHVKTLRKMMEGGHEHPEVTGD